MEHDNAYVLMMDALDGELAEERRYDLEAHLRACPACMQEWQAVTAVDMLFRQTPVMMPAAGFAERTMARLPNRQYRIWTVGAIYFMFLLAGSLPLLGGFWVVSKLGPVLNQPTLVRSLMQSLAHVFEVAGTVIGALLNGAGEFVAQQPAVIGWMLVMVGVVSLWGGVFQQVLSLQPQRQQL